MFHINSHPRCNVTRITGLLACLGLGLASGKAVLAQNYDRIIRPSDITLQPTGVEGFYRIRCTPSVFNGTENDLDLSTEVTISVNGQPIYSEILSVFLPGQDGPSDCDEVNVGCGEGLCGYLGPDSECVDLTLYTAIGCICTASMAPNPSQPASLSSQDDVEVKLVAAGGSEEEVHVYNDSARIVVGVPAATVTSAVSRRMNPQTRAFCDTDLHTVPPRKSEPHQGGIQEIRIGFDVAPVGGGSGWALEQATCTAPAFVPYVGGSQGSGRVVGNELVITFTPGLENARSYLLSLGAEITSIAGQTVEVRGLVGDVNSDGSVNATDRSMIVGAWTGGSFSCPSDVNNDGVTNATDRSVVVGAWTGGAATNCAP